MQTGNTTADIESTVRKFIAENYLYREGVSSIPDDASFLERGIIDSMGILELVSWLETTFKISVADHEVVPENLDSVSKVSEYIRRKAGGTGHAG